MYIPRINFERLQQLALYIADRSRDDEAFGLVKLNKILFFSDFSAYANTRMPITGATYAREKRGPVPRELKLVIQDLVQEEFATVVKKPYYGYMQTRLVPTSPPDMKGFTGEELAIVDKVIDSLSSHNAREVSELSHRFIGWQIAEIAEKHEDIPYDTVFLTGESLHQDELDEIDLVGMGLGV